MKEILEKLDRALKSSETEIQFGPEFIEQLYNSRLEKQDKERCIKAITTFLEDRQTPGLNFEFLTGGDGANHCSIRGSRNLRVILAVDPAKRARFLFANMGQHDEMYSWSKERDGKSDFNDKRNQVSITEKGASPARRIENTLNDALSGKFDSWQLFLPENMKNLATRQFNGASRVRGAAGTGKSVLALHRAKALAERQNKGKILFTTFSRSLANHMSSLFNRLPSPPRNVEFRNVDQLVRIIVSGEINTDDKDITFNEAFNQFRYEAAKRGFRKEYLREEIECVIRGRNTTREKYLDTDRFERLGRLKSLRKSDRELVWNLKKVWDSKLASRGFTTWSLKRIEALELLREGKTSRQPRYKAAIIDEAQDLSLVSMKLIRCLVCRSETGEVGVDAITMYDDTAQRFYAGGFLPKWVPIDVVGGNRSNTLTKNYRNRPEILYAAYVVRGDTLLVKDDGDDGAAKRPEPMLPSGPKPKFIQVLGSEEKFIREEIDRLVKFGGFQYEDIAVLTYRNRAVDDMLHELHYAEVPGVNLYELRENSTGKKMEGVRVGTFDRGKGLEFRTVFISRVGKTAFFDEKTESEPAKLFEDETFNEGEINEEEKEARRLLVDRLYVGMTRARDLLYLVADERPIENIEEAIRSNHIQDMKSEHVTQEWAEKKTMTNNIRTRGRNCT